MRTGFLCIICGLICLLAGIATAWAQPLMDPEGTHIRKGNARYQSGDFVAAEESYKQALESKANSERGIFNLGNAYYRQERYEEAAQQFGLASRMAGDKLQKAQAFHNMGNALMELKQYDKSIEAYKGALRLNPNDEETRYNLAYAQQMLKNQQQNQQQNPDQQKKQDNQEQNEEQQDQDQQKQEDSEQSQSSEGKPKNLSPEEIQRMLEALQYEEEKLQQQLQKNKARGQRRQLEKDW